MINKLELKKEILYLYENASALYNSYYVYGDIKYTDKDIEYMKDLIDKINYISNEIKSEIK